jgi:hypothetical protein
MNAIRFFANKNYAEIEHPVDTGHRWLGTDLFELQMGLIDIGNGQVLWGGTLQNINNGEKRFFKGWSGLVANLQEILTPSAQLEVLKALIRTKDAVY